MSGKGRQRPRRDKSGQPITHYVIWTTWPPWGEGSAGNCWLAGALPMPGRLSHRWKDPSSWLPNNGHWTHNPPVLGPSPSRPTTQPHHSAPHMKRPLPLAMLCTGRERSGSLWGAASPARRDVGPARCGQEWSVVRGAAANGKRSACCGGVGTWRRACSGTKSLRTLNTRANLP